MFLGGLDEDLAESDIRDHFSAFGNVSIAVLIYDHSFSGYLILFPCDEYRVRFSDDSNN